MPCGQLHDLVTIGSKSEVIKLRRIVMRFFQCSFAPVMVLDCIDGVPAPAIEIRFSLISMILTDVAQPPVVHAS